MATIPVEKTETGKFRLTKSFAISTSLRTFVIPKGFVTNFATTPKFMHWLFPPRGKYERAALLHDYFCNVNNRYTVLKEGKEVGDNLFYEIMKKDGVNLFTRLIFYYFVRWTGLDWGPKPKSDK